MTASHLDAIDRELDSLVPGLAKTRPTGLPRAAENEPARERFVEAIKRLRTAHGWSWDRVARCLGCSKTMVISVYDGDRYVSAWMLDLLDALPELQALPTHIRVAQLRRVS
jgi:hypothetical protein